MFKPKGIYNLNQYEVYSIQHLVSHLYFAQNEHQLYQLLTSKIWWKRKREIDLSGRTYSEDIDLAFELIEKRLKNLSSENDLGKIDLGSLEQYVKQLPEVFGLTLLKGFIQGIGKNIPIEAVVGLVEVGEVTLAMDYAAIVTDGGDLTGTKLFFNEIVRDDRNVLQYSKQAEVYRRIADKLLNHNYTIENFPHEKSKIDTESIARSALNSAKTILESKTGSMPIKDLFPQIKNEGLETSTNLINTQIDNKNEPNEIYSQNMSFGFSEEIFNATGGTIVYIDYLKPMIDIGNNGDHKREFLRELHDEIENFLVKNPEQIDKLLERVIDEVKTLGSGGWFGGDVVNDLTSLARQFARTMNSSKSLELIIAIKELSFSYEDQRARAIAGAVGALSHLFPKKATEKLLDEALSLAKSNKRLDFRVLALSSVAIALHSAGFPQNAQDVLREALIITREILPLYDRDFSLEALSYAAASNNDFKTLKLILSAAEDIQKEEQNLDLKFSRIVCALAKAGAYQFASNLLDEFWPLEEYSAQREQTVQTIISDMKSTIFIDNALEFIPKISDIIDCTQARCNLVQATSKYKSESHAKLQLRTCIKTILIPSLANESDEINHSIFNKVLEAAGKINAIDEIGRCEQLLEFLSKTREKAISSLLDAFLSMSEQEDLLQQEDRLLTIANRVQSSGLKSIAISKITLAKGRVRDPLDEVSVKKLDNAINLALKEENLNIRLYACRQVAYALAKCKYIGKFDSVLQVAIEMIMPVKRESHSSFMYKEMDSHTQFLLPNKRTKFLIDCIQLLKYAQQDETVDKTIVAVDLENNLLEKSYLIAELIHIYEEKKAFKSLDQISENFRKQLRSTLPNKRIYMYQNNYVWSPIMDANLVIEVVEAMALLKDKDGLKILFTQVQYLDHPEWNPHWNREQRFWAQSRTSGSIIGHMVGLGMMEEARNFLSSLRSDDERTYAVIHITRILKSQNSTEFIDSVCDIAEQVKDRRNFEFAQRQLTSLLTQKHYQEASWKAARNAVNSAIMTLARLPENNLFNCIQRTSDYVLPLANNDSIGAAKFILYTMKLARELGEPDVWAIISAIYPLPSAVAGGEMLVKIWNEIQKIKSIR